MRTKETQSANYKAWDKFTYVIKNGSGNFKTISFYYDNNGGLYPYHDGFTVATDNSTSTLEKAIKFQMEINGCDTYSKDNDTSDPYK